MDYGLPDDFLPSLKEAISEAIQSSPAVRDLIASAANYGTNLEIALVIGVLAGNSREDILDKFYEFLSESGGDSKELRNFLKDVSSEINTTKEHTDENTHRETLRLIITPEDKIMFKKLGLIF